MLIDYGFIWDSSQGVPPRATPVWPYTYDYKMPHKWVCWTFSSDMRKIILICGKMQECNVHWTSNFLNKLGVGLILTISLEFRIFWPASGFQFYLISEFRCRTESCPTRQFNFFILELFFCFQDRLTKFWVSVLPMIFRCRTESCPTRQFNFFILELFFLLPGPLD